MFSIVHHLKRMNRIVPLILLTFAPAFAEQIQSFSGKVISVQDGDTITVLRDGVPERIRLNGIDAPELGRGRFKPAQPFAQRAKQYAGTLAFGKTVQVQPHGRDRYGRMIAIIKLPDGRILNHEIVRAGLAWHFVKYAPNDDELRRLENAARAAKLGLWADQDAVAPWEWRKATALHGNVRVPASHVQAVPASAYHLLASIHLGRFVRP